MTNNLIQQKMKFFESKKNKVFRDTKLKTLRSHKNAEVIL